MRWLLAIVALVLAVPATAQTNLPIERGEPFRHELTGITLPGRIGQSQLTRVTSFDTSQYDIAFNYIGRGQQTMTTVYVYRAGFTDISVNFDMVVRGISIREGFSPAEKANLTPQAFIPRGHANADSLRLTWPVAQGGDFTTGGVALIPHGEWIIKVRISSSAHDPAELHDFIDEAVAALNLPASAYPAADAAMILPCTDQLAVGPARLIEAEPVEAMLYAMELEVASSVAAAVATVGGDGLNQRLWCRDSAYLNHSIYRPNGDRDSYALLINDAGNALTVSGYSGPATAPESESSSHVAVIYSNSDVSAVLGLFDALPAPDNVIAQLGNQPAIVTTDRAGNITINGGL